MLSPRGIVPTLIQGAKDGVAVVGGRAAGQMIASRLPSIAALPVVGGINTGDVLRQLVAAVAVGAVASRVAGTRAGQFAVAGAMAPVIESLIPASVKGAIGMNAYPGSFVSGVSAYPRGVSAYPSLRLITPAASPAGMRGLDPTFAAGGMATL